MGPSLPAGPSGPAGFRSALLLLGDGRFPAGGHAHSGGAAEAVASGRLRNVDDLRRFLTGRLSTAGLTAAGLAAAACRRAEDSPAPWALLDAEADARIAAPALRAASRRQGRQLLRAARRIWPSAVLDDLAGTCPAGAHHPVALGAASASAGLDAAGAALLAAQDAISGPASAALRLMSLDPVEVAAVVAYLGPQVDSVADHACARSAGPVPDLPAATGPLLEIGAERFVRRELRLFAS